MGMAGHVSDEHTEYVYILPGMNTMWALCFYRGLGVWGAGEENKDLPFVNSLPL